MKSKISIYTALLASCLLAACNTGAHESQGVDSSDSRAKVNPYRDTFKTTTTMGDATMLDNSGNGGTKIARPKTQTAMPATVKPDSTRGEYQKMQ